MSRNVAPITIELERQVCNDIGGCWPAAPTAPDPTSLALIAPPYIHDDEVTESYASGDIIWVYDSALGSWGVPLEVT